MEKKVKRPRTNMRGLCSHATPEGHSHMGETERLHKKFLKGETTKEEQYRLAIALSAYSQRIYDGSKVQTRKPKSVLVSVNQKKSVISYREYEQYYKPAGFPVVEEYY